MNSTTNRFGRVLVLYCLVLQLPVWLTARQAMDSSDTMPLPLLRQQRTAAASRTRRIIFNNDGNESFREVKELSEKGLLQPRTLGLEHTQVDAIYYCTSHAWGLFNHHTTVGTEVRVKEVSDSATLFKNNLTGELIDAGLDPLKVMVQFAHRNGKEIFWSMRMNDTHDGGKTGYGPVLFRANTIKTTHPEYLVGKPFEKGNGSWSAVNYSLPEVRNLTLRYIAEVCNNFDIDGIELDFFRHRVFFKSTFKGQRATNAERQQMTELMRAIRSLTEQVGLHRKRPILVSMRLPDAKEYAYDIGLDMETWLREGLLDILSVSSYIRLNPWQTSVVLGHRYGVPVYPSLDESRLEDTAATTERNSLYSYRAQATEAWAAGADGIYMFNYFNPQSPLWQELGSYTGLLQLDRDYYTTIRGAGKIAAVDHRPYLHLPVFSPDSALLLTAAPVAVPILFYGAKNDSGFIYLQWKLNQLPQPEEIEVTLNNQRTGQAKYAAGWYRVLISGTRLQNGQNTVRFTKAGTALKDIRLTDMKISYRRQRLQ